MIGEEKGSVAISGRSSQKMTGLHTKISFELNPYVDYSSLIITKKKNNLEFRRIK